MWVLLQTNHALVAIANYKKENILEEHLINIQNKNKEKQTNCFSSYFLQIKEPRI